MKINESDLKGFIEDGLTIEQISQKTGYSRGGIQYRLNKLNLKTKNKRGFQPKSLIGKRFDNLIVLKLEYKNHYGYHYQCLCNCGKRKIYCGALLSNGMIKGCGCLRGKSNFGRYNDSEIKKHIGEKHNRLTIIDYIRSHRKSGGYLCHCKCDCGGTAFADYYAIKSGNTQSCGCLQKERTSEVGTKSGPENYRNSSGRIWYFYDSQGNKIYCRSGFEVLYANFLVRNCIKFVYEPKTFVLSPVMRYTPDFYLSDTNEFVEIKGYDGGTQFVKRKEFAKTNKLKLLTWKDLITECGLSFRAYSTYFEHAKKQQIQIEDFLGQSLYY